MGAKIKAVPKQVKEAKPVDPATQLKEEERAEEQRLFQEARAALEVHLALDARWTEKQHEAKEEQGRAVELREVAKRLQGEAVTLEAAAAAGEQRATALFEAAKAVEAERAAAEEKWSEAVERWERLRYSLGLPFYDPEMGPPAWFTSHAWCAPGRRSSPPLTDQLEGIHVRNSARRARGLRR